jgi:iron(III) transport system ATP-binding protein
VNAAPALQVRDLAKRFDAPVLAGVDLEVQAGELTAVLGPSGCGKTTLLRLIAGFEHADAGTIELGGSSVTAPGRHVAPERRGVGFVPQEGALFPHLDVRGNIAFGLPRSQRNGARLRELVELLDLQGLERRLPHELSGGQQQRVALARALAPEPKLILLDEPFDALDAGLRTRVRTEVTAALRAVGATALLVTHDREEALSLADRVAVMRGGKIAQLGPPRELYRHPVDAGVARSVGDAVILPAEVVEDRAACALGRIALNGQKARGGAVTIMLRPEQIHCRPSQNGGPVGRIVALEFFGHDCSIQVELEHPERMPITARTFGPHAFSVGERVSLDVEGPATILSE